MVDGWLGFETMYAACAGGVVLALLVCILPLLGDGTGCGARVGARRGPGSAWWRVRSRRTPASTERFTLVPE